MISVNRRLLFIDFILVGGYLSKVDLTAIFSLLPDDAVICRIRRNTAETKDEIQIQIASNAFPPTAVDSPHYAMLDAGPFVKAIQEARDNPPKPQGVESEAAIHSKWEAARASLIPLSDYAKNFSKNSCNCDMEYTGLKRHHERCATNGK